MYGNGRGSSHCVACGEKPIVGRAVRRARPAHLRSCMYSYIDPQMHPKKRNTVLNAALAQQPNTKPT